MTSFTRMIGPQYHSATALVVQDGHASSPADYDAKAVRTTTELTAYDRGASGDGNMQTPQLSQKATESLTRLLGGTARDSEKEMGQRLYSIIQEHFKNRGKGMTFETFRKSAYICDHTTEFQACFNPGAGGR